MLAVVFPPLPVVPVAVPEVSVAADVPAVLPDAVVFEESVPEPDVVLLSLQETMAAAIRKEAKEK